jgi:hypothetical protein
LRWLRRVCNKSQVFERRKKWTITDRRTETGKTTTITITITTTEITTEITGTIAKERITDSN